MFSMVNLMVWVFIKLKKNDNFKVFCSTLLRHIKEIREVCTWSNQESRRYLTWASWYNYNCKSKVGFNENIMQIILLHLTPFVVPRNIGKYDNTFNQPMKKFSF